MRPDIDNPDEYVRNTTARALAVVASALGIPALLPFLKAACQSRKSWQARHTGIKIVQQIAILMGAAILPHLKMMVGGFVSLPFPSLCGRVSECDRSLPCVGEYHGARVDRRAAEGAHHHRAVSVRPCGSRLPIRHRGVRHGAAAAVEGHPTAQGQRIGSLSEGHRLHHTAHGLELRQLLHQRGIVWKTDNPLSLGKKHSHLTYLGRR